MFKSWKLTKNPLISSESPPVVFLLRNLTKNRTVVIPLLWTKLF